MEISITDQYLQRAVQVARVSDREALVLKTKLKKVHADLLKEILFKYENLTPSKFTILSVEIAKEIDNFYATTAQPDIKKLGEVLFDKEILWNDRALSSAFGSEVVLSKRARTSASIASKHIYQGSTFDELFADLGVKNSKRITDQLRLAWLNGASPKDAQGLLFSTMTHSEHNITTLTRSYMQVLSTTAREDSLVENSEFIDGRIWSSILDNRTTPNICGIRDQLKYDNDYQPINHGIPWGAGPGAIHFNCRSSSLPYIRGDNKRLKRTAVVADENYTFGDKHTRTGKVRKFTKNSRERGIYKIENTTTQSNYEKWLRRQPKDFVSDALNSRAKASEFLGGKRLTEFLPDSGLGSLGSVSNISLDSLL